MSLRRKIYEVIEVADKDDRDSLIYDRFMLVCIAASIVPLCFKETNALFIWLDRATVTVFIVDYLLRWWTADLKYEKNGKWAFLRYPFSFFGIVDLLATLPLYIGLLFPGARYLLIIRAFRLIRVFRVFKLFNFLNEGERLLTALRESSKKIAVFFLFVVILVTSIGTLMYMIEGTQPDSQFNNIPNSIYWAIVTMTTVGYGDITPVTGFGKFLSACVMLIGYTIIAVPTGIVSASMMKDYKRRRDKECPHCHRSGHEDNAGFCKYCGSSLNPKDEMQVKPEDESKENT